MPIQLVNTPQIFQIAYLLHKSIFIAFLEEYDFLAFFFIISICFSFAIIYFSMKCFLVEIMLIVAIELGHLYLIHKDIKFGICQ